jgi:ATP/maltotriose-dependent transcriptional regulator MalT
MTTMWGPTPATEGIAVCERVLASHPADVRVHAYGRIERGALRAMRGEIAEGREDVSAGRAIMRDLGMSITAATTAQEAFLVEMLAGDPAAAEAEMRAAWDQLERAGARSWMASAAARLGGVACVQGKTDVAYALSERTKQLAAEDDVDAQIRWRMVQAHALAHGGEAGRARSLASDAVRRASETDILNLRGDALTALGDVLAAGGDARGASAAYEEAREQYRRKGNVVAARVVGARSARAGGSEAHRPDAVV